jgi:hypothetical protein
MNLHLGPFLTPGVPTNKQFHLHILWGTGCSYLFPFSENGHTSGCLYSACGHSFCNQLEPCLLVLETERSSTYQVQMACTCRHSTNIPLVSQYELFVSIIGNVIQSGPIVTCWMFATVGVLIMPAFLATIIVILFLASRMVVDSEKLETQWGCIRGETPKKSGSLVCNGIGSTRSFSTVTTTSGLLV